MKTPSAWLALVAISACFSTPAFAQEGGVRLGPRGASIFAEFSAARTGQGEGTIWGGSGGGYFQGSVLGFFARATALPSNAQNRIYDVVVGPRLAVSLPLLRVFVEAGGGMGHAGNYNGPIENASWGAAWQADAGVSHGLGPRLDWRILDVGYGHVYAGGGVAPVVASTGLTLHLW